MLAATMGPRARDVTGCLVLASTGTPAALTFGVEAPRAGAISESQDLGPSRRGARQPEKGAYSD